MILWGKNPAPPSLVELWWVANNSAESLAAELPYDNSWEEGDERLPFVYKKWMEIGAPEPSELAKKCEAGSPPADIFDSGSPSGNLALPGSPPAGSRSPVAERAPRVAPPHAPASDIPPGCPAVLSRNGVAVLSEGMEKEDERDSSDAADSTGVAAAPRIHRYAPFTLERRKKVTEMATEFFKALHDYANEENIDLTAVTKCFTEKLTSMKLSSWQAFQQLSSIQRNGGSKYLNKAALFPCTDACVAFQRLILMASLMLLSEANWQLCKRMKRQPVTKT